MNPERKAAAPQPPRPSNLEPRTSNLEPRKAIIESVPAPAPTAVLTEAAILAALRDCYDPEISLNIVDLGLVHSISIAPDPDAPGAGIPGVPPRHRVSIALTLAQIADLEDTPLIAQIQNRLAAFETVGRTDITLLREPPGIPAASLPKAAPASAIVYHRVSLRMPSSKSKPAPPKRKPQSAPSLVPAPTRPRDLLKLTDFPIHPFDQAHGVDTSGLVPAKHLVTGHANDEHVTAYYGVAPSILRALIHEWRESVPPHPISSYTFIDIGAGKGRGLLVASEYPFRSVIGIELNSSLARIARANVAHWIATRAADPTAAPLAPIQVLEQDALDFTFPTTPTLLFLFHPFEAPVLRKLLRNIETQLGAPFATASSSRVGPALDLIYVNAECANVLDRNPAFTQLFLDNVKMSPEDHAADLEAIARQREYGSTGDEECAIYRYTGRTRAPIFTPAA